jgi:hypothetical protein
MAVAGDLAAFVGLRGIESFCTVLRGVFWGNRAVMSMVIPVLQ